MKQYKGVIFDLDGTLLDTLDDLKDSMNTILAKHGFPLINCKEAAAFLGNGSETFLQKSLGKQLPEAEFASYLDEYKAYYKEHMECKTRPYEGVWNLLASLQAAGIKTAVVSNKFDRAVKDICAKYFTGLLDFAIGEGNGLCPKPSVDMPKKAASNMGVLLQDCVYVGDTEVDIATAQAVHMNCISVTWGFRTEEQLLAAGAEMLVANIKELEEILLKESNGDKV